MNPLVANLPLYGARRSMFRARTMLSQSPIPVIDVSSLFSSGGVNRTRTDEAILRAAATPGFFLACNFPRTVPVDRESRLELLRLFDLPDAQIRPLWRKKFDASHLNVYRGWFPLQMGFLTSKEGIDMGPDVAYGSSVVRA